MDVGDCKAMLNLWSGPRVLTKPQHRTLCPAVMSCSLTAPPVLPQAETDESRDGRDVTGRPAKMRAPQVWTRPHVGWLAVFQ